MRQSLVSQSVVRSSPLSAYLDPDDDVPTPPEFDREAFVDEWREVFDSEAELSDRLGFADHTLESAREQFESASGDDPEGIPSAFETAQQVVDRAVESDQEAVGPLVDRHADSPFVHLVAPLAAAASERVQFDTDFAPAARESLVDWLLDRLTKGFRHPLFVLFKAYQRTEYPDIDFEDATDSTAMYDEFVQYHRDADYERVFEHHPVLLKFLGLVADQWCGAVRRLDERITADRDGLARTFNDGAELGRVADVETLSDDPHGDGELVLGVRFENDCSVVYKPRSVAGEGAFGELLDWTNAHADVPDLYVPTILDRSEYGWMEFVRHSGCDSTVEVERYYERMGAVSALAFVLGSTDFHYENIVAMGEHPVIVDQETALSPGVEAANAPGSATVSSVLEDSILDTLLIPFTKRTGTDGDRLTTSGLSELTGEEREQKLPNFRHPNTDAMELTFDKVCRFDGRNLPRLADETRDASGYLTELKRGFRNAATAIVARRDELLDPSGPLAAFEGSEVRYLLRPTGHYASKLNESRYSSRLRSGLQQSLLLESLYGIFVPRADDGDLWELVATEKETLRRFVVPRFTVEATGRELKDGRGNRLGVFVDESPVERARRRISDLDDHWVETQLRLVDLTFTDSKVSDPVAAPSDDYSIPGATSPEEVVSAVVGLVGETTTRHHDGGLRWAEPARSSPTDHLMVREPDADLYEGYAGVGLFLAAVASVRDDPQLADRSRRVLESAVSVLDPDASAIGGMTGNGSVAYGLATAGELLAADDLVERARTVASRTTRDDVAADTDLDVISGTAGELLAQLAVYERADDDAALDRARWCGDHLLDVTSETPSGYRVPTSGDAQQRFAFAHGVGGIGYALVKLGAVLDDPKYARVGRDALRYDTELWREHRDDSNSTERADSNPTERDDATDTVWGWCNGLAGVGTTRVAVADSTTAERVGDFPRLRESVQPELSGEDSLCCGSTGRALFMLDAGEVFADPALVERGEQLFANALDRADREGRLRLANHLPMLPKLGLFTGLTGVGYLALQFEARGDDVELPNVARLE